MSSAVPTRQATLDKQMTRLELVAAHGTVARPTPPSLPPARAQLAEHQANLAKLSVECERTGKPVDWLRQKLAEATAVLTQAEATLAGIDAAHSRAIAEAARTGTFSAEPVESVDAEAAVQRARRNVNSVRMALEEVAQDLVRANSNLEASKTAFDQLALRILIEEHDARLEHWAKCRDKYFIAEAELLGLHAAIGEHGRGLESKAPGVGIHWLQTLEKLHQPWHIPDGHVELGPREINAAASRWAAVLHRLKSDPGATF